jgi:hypothetical protein
LKATVENRGTEPRFFGLFKSRKEWVFRTRWAFVPSLRDRDVSKIT